MYTASWPCFTDLNTYSGGEIERGGWRERKQGRESRVSYMGDVWRALESVGHATRLPGKGLRNSMILVTVKRQVKKEKKLKEREREK